MSVPVISVVIPTRERDELLGQCLSRLAPGTQTLDAERYEVIVSDDGDSTTSEAMIRARFPWAIWQRGPRRGPAANRNSGARIARGNYLAFTDDDCVPSAGWLLGYVRSLTPSYDVYEGRTTCEAGVNSPRFHSPYNLTGGWLWSCNMLVKRELFLTLGGFDESYPHPHMEDADLRERLLESGHAFLFVPDAVVDHPPRRLAWGWKLGTYLESEVVFHVRRRQPVRGGRLIIAIMKHRLRPIVRLPFSLDTISAAASCVVEGASVVVRMPLWKRKHVARGARMAR